MVADDERRELTAHCISTYTPAAVWHDADGRAHAFGEEDALDVAAWLRQSDEHDDHPDLDSDEREMLADEIEDAVDSGGLTPELVKEILARKGQHAVDVRLVRRRADWRRHVRLAPLVRRSPRAVGSRARAREHRSARRRTARAGPGAKPRRRDPDDHLARLGAAA